MENSPAGPILFAAAQQQAELSRARGLLRPGPRPLLTPAHALASSGEATWARAAYSFSRLGQN
jgi:hypothetical protein